MYCQEPVEDLSYTFLDEVPELYPVRNVSHASGTPLVLDNGSWKARLGWAGGESPEFVYRNLVARFKPDALVGNDIQSLESVRSSLRAPFERNIVTQPDVFEVLVEYGASRIGTELENAKIVLTEAPLNPRYCRESVAELLFEKFRISSLLTGIDALFAGYHQNPEREDAMHVVFGHSTCHVLPYLDGKLRLTGAQRLNLGGCDLVMYMLKLLQLKNALRAGKITYSRAEDLMSKFCQVAEGCYPEFLRSWIAENRDVRLVLPAARNPEMARLDEAAAEARQAQALERKEAQIRRLKEMHRKRWEKKIEELEKEIMDLVRESERTKPKTRDNSDEENESDIDDDYKFEEEEEEEDEREVKDRERRKVNLSARLEDARKKLENLDEDFGRNSEKKMNEEWVDEMRQRRRELIEKKDKIRDRYSEMSNRRSRASRDRLRMLWQLAADDQTVAGRKREKQDNFGAKDEDWDVYMVINRENWDSEHDVDMQIYELDQLLAQHDEEHRAFLAAASEAVPPPEMYLSTERVRVPELLFQPAAFLGIPQGGIVDGLDASFRSFEGAESQRLADNVVVSGSVAQLPGLKSRLEHEIRTIRPFQTPFQVNFVEDVSLDAWRGASDFASKTENDQFFVTKKEYEENGASYYKEHACSNQFFVDEDAEME